MNARWRMPSGWGRSGDGGVSALIGLRQLATHLIVVAACFGLTTTGAVAQTSGAGGIGDLLANLLGTSPKASDTSRSGQDARTRFKIAIERPVEFQVFALTNPNRVIVDMPAVGMQLPSAVKRPSGVITGFRGGRSAADRTRVIIDVNEAVVVDAAYIARNPQTGGDEIIVDVMPTREKIARDKRRKQLQARAMGVGLRPGSVQPPTPRAAASPEVLRERAFRPIIVIDPGHGGRDPGASKNGVVEKDVVLKFSLVLRDMLNETGRYRVLMTRDTDVFIPLAQRRRFAERNKAALFIAVHADYARAGARGATIFSLRDRVARRLERSAKASVKGSVLTRDEASRIRNTSADVSSVRHILADLAAREVEANDDRTALFTQAVIETMSTSTNMRKYPDKEAAFAVLRTAKVPSVLIELAFVTNRRDARNLKSATWRKRVAGSIMTAINNYFSHTLARIPL